MKTPNEIITTALSIYRENFGETIKDFAGHAYFESCVRAVLFVEDCEVRKELTRIQFENVNMAMTIKDKEL